MPNPKLETTSNPNPRENPADRAQPGDVLGVERDGKRTHLGDTAEDENEELEEAEDEIRDLDEDDD